MNQSATSFARTLEPIPPHPKRKAIIPMAYIYIGYIITRESALQSVSNVALFETVAQCCPLRISASESRNASVASAP